MYFQHSSGHHLTCPSLLMIPPWPSMGIAGFEDNTTSWRCRMTSTNAHGEHFFCGQRWHQTKPRETRTWRCSQVVSFRRLVLILVHQHMEKKLNKKIEMMMYCNMPSRLITTFHLRSQFANQGPKHMMLHTQVTSFHVSHKGLPSSKSWRT